MDPGVGAPKALVAELTYRCNMFCYYCYNPTDLSAYPAAAELTTDEWVRVLTEAAKLGVLHVHFTGGEPTLRRDLPELVAWAKAQGLYVNLITNLTLYDEAYWRDLIERGVDHVQASFQAHEPTLNDRIGGPQTFKRKMERMAWLRDTGVYLTLNVVLHRWNIDDLEAILHFAHDLGVERLELAMTQFAGWAWKNRAALLPTPEQVERAVELARQYKERWADTMVITMVGLDFYEKRPKPCMLGWGQVYMVVNPVGEVLPCHGAKVIRELRFDTVRDRSLADIWWNSEAFQRFRGEAWLPEPCRSCPLRTLDFGGCRCQAYLLTGRADVTDPVCEFSPHRPMLDALIESTLRSVDGKAVPRTHVMSRWDSPG
ncbi:MAG: pyrroloquinoline quinone biosynthesis protein PqqE [Acidobacteria bacterium]|nr:pyrroloquinoline quinone biosynthesis protein PqqE [Acidobacteriota bacterium]MDW7983849.1 pyrroloquinoline quinone biosynthesis protein PqqE [Acidobacteriota bacterium]